MKLHPLRLALCLLLLALLGTHAVAADWPGWRGPRRNGLSTERGLLKQWPDEGPPLLWKKTGLGEGYSTPSVVGNMLYTMGNGNGKEWVVALDVSRKGLQVWASATGMIGHKGGGYAGPRSTPTVDDDRLYALGLNGQLVCMNTRDGSIRWHRNLVEDFGGKIPQWGYSESVLVDGDRVICTPGGETATVAALNKMTGETVWTSPIGHPASYSSIMPVKIGGVPQYVTLTGKSLVGVAAANGKLLWSYDAPANTSYGGINVATPISLGQTVFASSGYGTGAGCAWIRRGAGGFQAQQIYFTKDLKNHHGGVLLIDGYLYGANDPGILTCLDYKTGKVMWKSREPGKCSLVYADGMLICRSEKGPVTLVEATPREFRLRGKFDQPDRSGKNAWPYPIVVDGRLYLRDQDVLLCYDLRAKRRR